MLINELLERKLAAPTQSQCSIGKARLSNVRYAQCVARGMLAHDSEHTDGRGTQGVKGSGTKQKGRKLKSTKFGGDQKYYPGSRN
jgi:hypothetical protein